MFYNFFNNKAEMKTLNLLDVLKMYDYNETQNKTKIRELPKSYHSKLFDFEYPLTNNLNKDDFEIRIINHFLLRRIGFETIQAFQIYLEDKLNSIMPLYNQMIDNIYYNSNIFKEITENESKTDSTNTINTSGNTNSTSNNSGVNDLRHSDTPQNNIADVRSGQYLTDYDYNTSTDYTSTKSNATNESVNISDMQNNNQTVKYLTGKEIKEFYNELNNVYNLIFDELEPLFLQII